MRSLPAALTLLLVACGGQGGPPAGAGASGDGPPLPSEERMTQLDQELAEAIGERARRIEAAPEDGREYLELGMLYEAHSQHDLALPAYERAVALLRDDAKAWYRLGLARARGGDLAGARAALERTLALRPDYTAARLRLGFLLLDAGEPAAAREAFEGAGDLPAALQGLAQADLEQDRPAEALQRLSDPALREGAAAALTERLRGQALARLGRDEQAREALARGRGARPAFADPWTREVSSRKVGVSALLLRARKLLDRGKPDAAAELLQPLEERDDARVLRLLAAIVARQGRYAEAASLLERAAALEPDEPLVVVALASALEQGLRASEARGVLEAYLESHPGQVEPWEALARLWEGDPGRVIEVCLRAEEAGVRSRALALAHGEAALAQGRAEEALLAFTRATELDSRCGPAWKGSARARLALGQEERAAQDLERAESLGEECADLRAELGGKR